MKVLRSWDENGRTYYEFSEGRAVVVKSVPKRGIATPTGRTCPWVRQMLAEAQAELDAQNSAESA